MYILCFPKTIRIFSNFLSFLKDAEDFLGMSENPSAHGFERF